MKPREWSVVCSWCDARPGHPCIDPKGESYSTAVHRTRANLYYKMDAINRAAIIEIMDEGPDGKPGHRAAYP